MLDLAWIVCPADAQTFATNDPATNYDTAYQATYNFVSTYRDSITDWELGNEIDLITGQNAAPGAWNTGWAATDWENVSAYGSPDYYTNWAWALKGASDAIAAINSKYGTKLRRILNTTGTHVGFLDFMSSNGVGFEMISYHYYQNTGTSPYLLAASPPASGQGSWNLFAGLAAYNLPVTIDEFNCGEIYDSGYQDAASDPLYATCLTNLRAQIGYFKNNAQLNIESIIPYELLDEPSQAAPENHFGLFFNDGNGNYAPKANLLLWSAFAGGALSSPEQAILRSLSLLPLP
jgi:hypothetical protein